MQVPLEATDTVEIVHREHPSIKRQKNAKQYSGQSAFKLEEEKLMEWGSADGRHWCLSSFIIRDI